MDDGTPKPARTRRALTGPLLCAVGDVLISVLSAWGIAIVDTPRIPKKEELRHIQAAAPEPSNQRNTLTAKIHPASEFWNAASNDFWGSVMLRKTWRSSERSTDDQLTGTWPSYLPVPKDDREGTFAAAIGWPCRAMSWTARIDGTELLPLINESIPHTTSGCWTVRLNDTTIRLPLRPRWPGFLANSLLYAATLATLFWLPRLARRMFRRRAGTCVTCGYPLDEAVSPRCPECGDASPAHDLRPERRRIVAQTDHIVTYHDPSDALIGRSCSEGGRP